MEEFFEIFVRRPVAAIISGCEVIGEDIAPALKVDAAISRAIHILSRAATRHRCPFLSFDADTAAVSRGEPSVPSLDRQEGSGCQECGS